MNLEPRTPSHSRTVLSQVMELGDANLANNVHGGVIMRLVDSAAGIASWIGATTSSVVSISSLTPNPFGSIEILLLP